MIKEKKFELYIFTFVKYFFNKFFLNFITIIYW